MRIKITIKEIEQTLYKQTQVFTTPQEAQSYAMGVCQGLTIAGINPNKVIIKKIKDK